ncbi:MAG: hypothetical protein MUF84_15820 [Anaerolineae bacterium]|nr:hypothetical protein [Anaerolineae bacterium]
MSGSTRRPLLVVGLLLAFAAGFAVAISLPDGFEQSLSAALRDPETALRGWRLRRQLPSVDIAVDFETYQRWMRVVAAQTAQGFVPSDADCATVEVRGGDTPLAGTLCPTVEGPQSGNTRSPEFTLEVAVDVPWLGTRRATLAPADPSSVLGVGYLRMMAEEGLTTPHRQLLDLRVNGTGWGVYILEAAPEVYVEAGDVLVTYSGAALPHAALVAPERSFAYARTVFTSVVGSDGVAPDDPPVGRAAALLAALESSAVVPSSAIDSDALGRMVAATALWHGTALPDWRNLALVLDPESGRFVPIPAGWTPDADTPLPSSFVDDPEVQRAIAVSLDRYTASGLVDSLLASGDLEALYVALGGVPGGLRASLVDHQAAMDAMATPSRTLYAWIAEEPGAIRLDLRAVLPFPVELLGLDFDGLGTVRIDPAWAPDDGASLSVVEDASVVLEARVGDAPVTATLFVPQASLPANLRAGLGTLSLVTRVWGLETAIPVIVETASTWSGP